MKKLISSIFSISLFFLFAGCTTNVFDMNDVNGGEIGGINIAVDVDATGVISKYSVISASLTIVDPLGHPQFTNWTVTATNHQFNFQSTVPGLHYICLTDYDSLGDTNVFYTNINFTAGHNYKLLVKLGADLKLFGIYAETIPLGVNWGIPDIALDRWDTTTGISEDTTTAGEGTKSYKFVGGTAGWVGVSYRTNPLTTYKDMHSYKEGSLRFLFKGLLPVRVGIQDGAGTQRWVYSADMFKFGLLTNDTWCSVIIPFTNFATNIDFSQIANYLTIIGEVGTINGAVYHFDAIHWCNKTN